MVKVALCLQFGVRVDTEEVVWIVGTCFVDIFDSIWHFCWFYLLQMQFQTYWETTKHARFKPNRVFVNEENHVVPFLTFKGGQKYSLPPCFLLFWIWLELSICSIDEEHQKAMAKMKEEEAQKGKLTCGICQVSVYLDWWVKSRNFLWTQSRLQHRLHHQLLPSCLKAASQNKKLQSLEQTEASVATFATCTSLRRSGWTTTTRGRSTVGCPRGWSSCCRCSGSSRRRRRCLVDRTSLLNLSVLSVSKGFGL